MVACAVCHLLRQSSWRHVWLLPPPLLSWMLRPYWLYCLHGWWTHFSWQWSPMCHDWSLITEPSVYTIKPVLNCANVCSPNILPTVRRTMIHFLIELLVRWTWFRQFEEFTCSQMACNEMQASARTCSRQHDQKCWLKSSQGNSTNYYLILGLRDKAAPSTSQQINKFPVKRVKNLATPSSIFIFSSSTGELCSQPIRGNVQRTGWMFPEHVEQSFFDPEYSFNEYFQLGSQRKFYPIKNQLGPPNTSN